MLGSVLYCLGTLFFLAAIASAQTETAIKIGVINSSAFEDRKSGIVRLVTAIDAARWEFGGDSSTLRRRLKVLNDEIETLRTQANSDVDAKTVIAKFDEAEKLKREIKVLEEEYQRRFDRRFELVVRPVMDDIAKALKDFAKQNHYAMIFDIAKDDAGLLVTVDENKVDVTKDFIGYFNAKPMPTTVK